MFCSGSLCNVIFLTLFNYHCCYFYLYCCCNLFGFHHHHFSFLLVSSFSLSKSSLSSSFFSFFISSQSIIILLPPPFLLSLCLPPFLCLARYRVRERGRKSRLNGYPMLIPCVSAPHGVTKLNQRDLLMDAKTVIGEPVVVPLRSTH